MKISFFIFLGTMSFENIFASESLGEHLSSHISQYPVPAAFLIIFFILVLGLLILSISFWMTRRRVIREVLVQKSDGELMNLISQNSDLYFFKLALDDRLLEDSGNRDRAWKCSDGYALRPKYVVIEDDAEKFATAWNTLREGKVNSVKLDYRIAEGNEILYYEVFAVRQYSRKFSQIIISGVVRNKTEYMRILKDYESQKLLMSAIMEHSHDLICVKSEDINFNITDCSNALLKKFGVEKSNVIGTKEWGFLNSIEYSKFSKKDMDALESGVLCRDVDTFTTPSGEICVGDFNRYPFKDAYGTKKILTIASDITAQSRLKDSLDDTKKFLDTILSNQPCIFTLKDIDDEFRYFDCNDAMCRMLNLQKSEIIGKNDNELFVKSDYYKQRISDISAAQNGEFSENIAEFYDGNNVLRKCRVLRRKVNYCGRNLLMSIALDITDAEKIKTEYNKNTKIMEAVLSSIPSWVAVKDIDNDYKYLLWNRKAEELTGIRAEEIIGKRDTDFPVLNRNAAKFRQNSRFAAENSGYLHVGDYKWILPDGGEIMLDSYLVHFECDNKKYEIVTCNDITSAMAISQKGDKEMFLIDAIDIPVVVFDGHHKLLHANPAAGDLAHKKGADIFKFPCYSLFCKFENFPSDCPVEKCLSDLKPHCNTRRVLGLDFMEFAVPIFSDGNLKYVLKYMLNVTDVNSLRKKLAETLELEKSSNAKNFDFISSFGKSLRESINGIVGNIELLSGNIKPDKEGYTDFANLKSSSLSMMQILDNFQDFVHLKSENRFDIKGNLVPSLFFSDFKKFVPADIEVKFGNIDIPGLAINPEALRILLINLILGISEYSDSIELEMHLLRGTQLEVRLKAADADKIKTEDPLSINMKMAYAFAEKLGGKIEFEHNCAILSVDSVERL